MQGGSLLHAILERLHRRLFAEGWCYLLSAKLQSCNNWMR